MSSIYTALICAAMRGENPSWPKTFGSDQANEFIEFAQIQGMLALLNQHAKSLRTGNWPASIINALAIASTANLRMHQTRRHYVSDFCCLLQLKGITALLFKGAATAYQLYDEPSLRQHADIDLLIPQNQVQIFDQIMLENGYKLDDIAVTKFGPFQKCAIYKPKDQPAVIIDIHWRINNRLILASCLNYNELKQAKEKLSHYFGPVYAVGISDALLLACIHEAGGEVLEKHRLSGLYDIHLILNRLSDEQIVENAQRATDKRIATIFNYVIIQSLNAFADRNQKRRIENLLAPFKTPKPELSAALLKPNKTWLEQKWLDFSAVKSTDKISYLLTKVQHKLTN